MSHGQYEGWKDHIKDRHRTARTPVLGGGSVGLYESGSKIFGVRVARHVRNSNYIVLTNCKQHFEDVLRYLMLWLGWECVTRHWYPEELPRKQRLRYPAQIQGGAMNPSIEVHWRLHPCPFQTIYRKIHRNNPSLYLKLLYKGAHSP